MNETMKTTVTYGNLVSKMSKVKWFLRDSVEGAAAQLRLNVNEETARACSNVSLAFGLAPAGSPQVGEYIF